MGAPLKRCQWPQQMTHIALYGNHTDPICKWLDVNARGGHLQGGIVFPNVLAKRYGGRGEACTRGRLRSEQVSQWLKRRNGEEGLTAARSAFNTTKVCVSSGSLTRPNHSSAMLALNCPTPYVKHRNTSLIKFWKGDTGCCVQILLTPRLRVLLVLLVCQPGTSLGMLLAIAVPLLLPLLVYQPGTGLGVLLVIAIALLLALLVCQPGTGLGVLLAIAVALLLTLLVCQPSTGLGVLLAIAVALLLALLVCQPGTGLRLLLAMAAPLLMPGCDGHGSLGSISNWSYRTL